MVIVTSSDAGQCGSRPTAAKDENTNARPDALGRRLVGGISGLGPGKITPTFSVTIKTRVVAAIHFCWKADATSRGGSLISTTPIRAKLKLGALAFFLDALAPCWP
jgi:hypothetical protein